MVPKATAFQRWSCQVIRPANCCHLIPSNRFLDGFPDPSQFAAAKLTHYSTMPHRPSDSSRPRQCLLLSGDVHQNPGPATKYPCSVCTSNQTVVPLLANAKKASLQAVHTSFVNTAIDNMRDNRVLNYRPPPISDKEIYLTRRQRATLSQLRSGHCKLLNSY